MAFDKNKIRNCPYCSYEATTEEFMTWEKDGKRGLLGKTPEGYIRILCPNCDEHIKYDTLSNTFLKEDQKSNSGKIFNLILVVITFAILYGLYKLFF